MFGKIFAGLLGGLLIALLGTFLVTIAVATPESSESVVMITFWVFWALAMMLAMMAERPAKAWRRIFVAAGVLALCLPLASLIFTGNVASQVADGAGENAAAVVAGAAIGGGFVTIMAGFVGFFLGAIFLVIGLVIGRDKQVVIIQQQAEK